MMAALLGTLIPIGYLMMMSASFFCAYTVDRRQGTEKGDATFGAGLICIFWPVTMPVALAWFLANRREGDATGMSRKQQRTLAFERERAEIAKEAVKAQREWQQLLEKEARA